MKTYLNPRRNIMRNPHNFIYDVNVAKDADEFEDVESAVDSVVAGTPVRKEGEGLVAEWTATEGVEKPEDLTTDERRKLVRDKLKEVFPENFL